MKIVKGTITIDGVLYKAFQNTFNKKWYIVCGETCFDMQVAANIEARSAKQAIELWLETRKEQNS